MKAYAIKDPKGTILLDTISDKEVMGSIFLFGKYHADKTMLWEGYIRLGYRCVPVLITEIKTDK